MRLGVGGESGGGKSSMWARKVKRIVLDGRSCVALMRRCVGDGSGAVGNRFDGISLCWSFVAVWISVLTRCFVSESQFSLRRSW